MSYKIIETVRFIPAFILVHVTRNQMISDAAKCVLLFNEW